jgi:hypothetical protein
MASLVLEEVSRNLSTDARVDNLDVADPTPGYAVIRTAAHSVLVTCPLPLPAFGDAGAVTPGLATANAIAPANPSAGGVAAEYLVYDGNDVLQWTGDVGTSGAGMTVATTTVVEGIPFAITAWTHSQPSGA